MLEIQLDENTLKTEAEDIQKNTLELDENINISKQNNFDNATEALSPNKEISGDDCDTPPEPNCLALTVRKNYSLTVVKNIFTKSGRMTLKIALSTLALNLLKIFF